MPKRKMTLDEAMAKLKDVSERLHSVANYASSEFRAPMHREAIEFDDAVAVIAEARVVIQAGGGAAVRLDDVLDRTLMELEK